MRIPEPDGSGDFQQADTDWEWDEEITVLVTVRVRARPNPEWWEGLMGRTPEDLAVTAAWRGGMSCERVDGWADMVGECDIVAAELA